MLDFGMLRTGPVKSKNEIDQPIRYGGWQNRQHNDKLKKM
jgi:hypothetical protein